MHHRGSTTTAQEVPQTGTHGASDKPLQLKTMGDEPDEAGKYGEIP